MFGISTTLYKSLWYNEYNLHDVSMNIIWESEMQSNGPKYEGCIEIRYNQKLV